MKLSAAFITDGARWQELATALKPGAWVILRGTLADAAQAEEHLALRDTLAVITQRQITLYYLLQRPRSGTYLQNIDRHACAALDIQGQRLTSGRWPANVLFVHTPDCQPQTVSQPEPYTYPDRQYTVHGFMPDCRPVAPSNYNDAHPVQGCALHCPVRAVAIQSGTRLGWHSQRLRAYNPFRGASLDASNTVRAGFHAGYDDTGTAARFFWQAQNVQDVYTYLCNLIKPPSSGIIEVSTDIRQAARDAGWQTRRDYDLY